MHLDSGLYNRSFNPLLKRRITIVFPDRHYQSDDISLNRTFAFFCLCGVAAGIMETVLVALLVLLLNPSGPLPKQGLGVLGLISAFSIYILPAYKISRFYNAMFGGQQKRGTDLD